MASQQWDTKAARAWLRKFSRSQLPFVSTVMLNDLAFKARKEVQQHLQKELILRNQWVKRGVIVKKATKSTLRAIIMHRDSFMYKQEHGGKVTGQGNRIAIPRMIRKSPLQRITKAKRPKKLLSNPAKYWLGPHGIMKRTKKKGPATVMYQLKKTVRYKPSIDMDGVVLRTVARHQGQSWQNAFNRFVRSAGSKRR